MGFFCMFYMKNIYYVPLLYLNILNYFNREDMFFVGFLFVLEESGLSRSENQQNLPLRSDAQIYPWCLRKLTKYNIRKPTFVLSSNSYWPYKPISFSLGLLLDTVAT